MKNLLYKEFKLAWHPLCYVFPIVFSCFILIPNYPSFIGMMMATLSYTILFIGANKGKQTNDLLYSVNLPVKKGDIVLARYISMAVMQAITIILTIALAPLSQLIRNALNIKTNMGFDLAHIGNTIAFALIAFTIIDACYILMFYKKGRSVIAPSLIGFLVALTMMTIFTIVLPLVIPAYNHFFCDKIWVQFVVLSVAILIYSLSHFFILREGINRIKKLDF